MFRFIHRRRSGFTLVEMAIVLGVAGILFGGLWRLLSASSQQLRDQSVANIHSQILSSVSAYLQSPTPSGGGGGGGADFLTVLPTAGATGIGTELHLPTNGSCGGMAAAETGFCDFLPSGVFRTTTNAYGQTFRIVVRREDGSSSGTIPKAYSFLIETTGGQTIPDTSGGRIASMIGGDGGFVYTNNVCGAASICGAFGSWSLASNAYVGAGAWATVQPGRVASRTHVSSGQISDQGWLARIWKGDILFNRMSTPLYFGAQPVYFGSTAGTSGNTASTLYVQGGDINLGNVDLKGLPNSTEPSRLHGGTENADIPMMRLVGNMGGSAANSLIYLGAGCTKIDGGTCRPALQVEDGDITVHGQLDAESLYATKFIYDASAGGSDARLKKDVKPLSNSLESVMKIKPVSYTLKASGAQSMGVIAQDMEKIYPQLVVKDNKGYMAVKYDALIAPLIDSVQILKKENDSLRKELKAVSDQLKEIEQTVKSPQQK